MFLPVAFSAAVLRLHAVPPAGQWCVAAGHGVAELRPAPGRSRQGVCDWSWWLGDCWSRREYSAELIDCVTVQT